MNLYIYSDESGVFDYIHNEYFVFSGLIFLSKESKDNYERKYKSVEKEISKNYFCDIELKAKDIKNKEKRRLFNVLNDCYKFSCIIKQQRIYKQIFLNKKSKQRYLDYAFKMGLKCTLSDLIKKQIINKDDIENLTVYCDEHTTATDGKYELRELLLNEFKYGTFNSDYMTYYAPLFSNLKDIKLKFCDSKNFPLIRGADIIANRIYGLSINNKFDKIKEIKNINVKFLP